MCILKWVGGLNSSCCPSAAFIVSLDSTPANLQHQLNGKGGKKQSKMQNLAAFWVSDKLLMRCLSLFPSRAALAAGTMCEPACNFPSLPRDENVPQFTLLGFALQCDLFS